MMRSAERILHLRDGQTSKSPSKRTRLSSSEEQTKTKKAALLKTRSKMRKSVRFDHPQSRKSKAKAKQEEMGWALFTERRKTDLRTFWSLEYTTCSWNRDLRPR